MPMENCCLSCKGKCVTLVKTFTFVRKVARCVAVSDAVIGIIILAILIARRSLQLNFSSLKEEEKTEQITKIVILSLFGVQILLAFIFYEGARKEILWMIKAWLTFCLFKLTVQMVSLTRYLNSDRVRTTGSIEWTKFLQIAGTLYAFLEAIIILIFRHHVERNESAHLDPAAANEDPAKGPIQIELDAMEPLHIVKSHEEISS